MKIKRRPEDFVVRELDRFELGPGPFRLYRLEKWDIGTIEAIGNVARKWALSRSRISFGGLKDRHARTEQIISVRHGPERDFEGSSFRLRFLGTSRDPITRGSFDANAFEITVRDLDRIPDPEPVRRWGVPNYFDDQRFGSLRGTGGEFIGRCLVRGDVERALRLALASPSGRDRKRRRAMETLMRDHWGDWEALFSLLPPGNERGIVHYLREHPGAFAPAFELLDENLRILYVSAYQSHLWNRALADRIRSLPETFDVPYEAGRLTFYRALPDEGLFELAIPLLTATSPVDDALLRILEEDGVEQRMFRLARMKKTFFGKGTRRAIVRPAVFSAEAAADELHPGRRKWSLSFQFPKGSYATVLLKRLFEDHLPTKPEGGR